MASIQKRGKRWRAVVRRTGHATQIKTFPLKTAAESWARMVERDMDTAEFVDRRTYKETGRTLLERYRNEVSPKKKGARWEVIRLGKLAKAVWMVKPLNEVTRKDITDWMAAQTVSPPSLRREMVLLSSVFNYASEVWGLPVKNPIRGVSLPEDSKARERRPSATELGAIRAYFQNKQMGLAVELAIETAMRLGEIMSIKWQNVYTSERYVHLIDTKNGDERRVPLSTRAVALLKAAKEVRGEGEKVFSISTLSAGVYWRSAMKELGIEDLHFHDLRHEAITKMAERFANVLELAAVTGHRNLKYLQRYYNPCPTALAERLG